MKERREAAIKRSQERSEEQAKQKAELKRQADKYALEKQMKV